MSIRPVSEYLTHFRDAGENVEVPIIAEEGLYTDTINGNDVESRLVAAREEGQARGLEEGRREGEALLEKERQSFEGRLCDEKRRWTEEFAQSLKHDLYSSIQHMGEEIADTVERILRPFLADKIRERAIIELKTTILTLGNHSGGKPIIIKGPKEILDILVKEIPSKIERIDTDAAVDPEVKITLGDSHIETRLQTWLSCLTNPSEQ